MLGPGQCATCANKEREGRKFSHQHMFLRYRQRVNALTKLIRYSSVSFFIHDLLRRRVIRRLRYRPSGVFRDEPLVTLFWLICPLSIPREAIAYGPRGGFPWRVIKAYYALRPLRWLLTDRRVTQKLRLRHSVLGNNERQILGSISCRYISRRNPFLKCNAKRLCDLFL